MTKISDLVELLGAGVDQANDLLTIVDMSETGAARNKKIKITQLLGLITDIAGLLDFSGSTDCSANPNYPVGVVGDAYLVSVAGKIGGASGKVVEVGDFYVAITDNAGGNEATVGTSWTVIQGNITATIPTELDDLTDVNSPSPSNGDVLTWDSTPGEWVASAPTGGSNALDDLTDVNAPTPAAGDVLTWDDTPGEWVALAPSGGSYSAENARDDIGTALTEGTGIDIAVDDGADTITITNTRLPYEGGPITPATTADLSTWINQDSSTVTDGTGAMILSPQVNAELHSRVKAAPATPYDIYCRVDIQALSTAANTSAIDMLAGIVFRDSSDNEMVSCTMAWSRIAGDEQNEYAVAIQRWTSDGGTLTSSPVYKRTGQLWHWLRVNNNGTTLTFYASMDGKNWIQVGTETIATHIDTVSQHGVGAYASANATEAYAQFAYFSTTAPS